MGRNVKRWQLAGAPTESQLDEIAALLRSGGIVLLPTDTIYGLHALANDASSAKIAAMKSRIAEKRFVIIAASVAQLVSIGADVPSMLNNIWPAPLTAILRRGTGTIAARVPASKSATTADTITVGSWLVTRYSCLERSPPSTRATRMPIATPTVNGNNVLRSIIATTQRRSAPRAKRQHCNTGKPGFVSKIAKA